MCTLLSLPTPASPHPRGRSNLATEGAFSSYVLWKLLLVDYGYPGRSTI
ncbi:hypothetical protein SOVF_216480 [Spinacia oleracea]|nr:hypothetical protein SOVF_216480 [Spinacia oleracea]